MTSPACTVNSSVTTNGVNVSAGSTPTIALADTAGVRQWSLSCVSTDDSNTAAAINATLSINSVAKTATFTAAGLASATLWKSVVNNGKDVNGRDDPSLTTTFAIFVLSATGLRVGAFGETTEGNAAFGWITKFNDLVRGAGVNADGLGVDLKIRKAFAAAGPGTADDITIYNANAPFGFRILDAMVYISTAIGGKTATLRSASGGGGSALSDAFDAGTTGVKRNSSLTATPTVAANGSLFLRRSDNGIAGEVIISIQKS